MGVRRAEGAIKRMAGGGGPLTGFASSEGWGLWEAWEEDDFAGWGAGGGGGS